METSAAGPQHPWGTDFPKDSDKRKGSDHCQRAALSSFMVWPLHVALSQATSGKQAVAQ